MADSGRRQLVGVVLASKMEKTIVVQITRRFAHPVYKKFVSKSKKYYADDPTSVAQAGDTVKIIEARQLSKLKRWRLVEITKKVEGLK